MTQKKPKRFTAFSTPMALGVAFSLVNICGLARAQALPPASVAGPGLSAQSAGTRPGGTAAGGAVTASDAIPGMSTPVPSGAGATRGATGAAAIERSPGGVRNGFAEHLRPVTRRKAGIPPQPYAPIGNQTESAPIPEIDMFVGESRVFPAPNVGRIAVGNGQIMTAAALDKKEVIVFANGAGTSSLFVWNEDGRYQRIKVNIVAGDTSRVAREVGAFLASVPNVKTSVVGDKVIVEGDDLADVDLAKIEQLEKRYPQVVNFTNRIGWEQMVMMDVKVVEFPKSDLRDIGLQWGAAGGATLAALWAPVRYGNASRGGQYTLNIPAPASGLPVTSADAGAASTGIPLPSALNLLGGINLGLNAQLNLLEQQGKAAILAEPQLSARNGAKASFLAGGEFPYSVANTNGVTIIFKPYGIKLDISPKVDHNGVVRATIVSEVSSIDSSVTTTAGPALQVRRTDTEFNVRSGETMVLAGLIQRSVSTDIDKVPLLGDVPLLGALFRSKHFQDKETELVVFVTPTVIDSHAPGLIDRVNRTKERLEQRMGGKPYLSDPLQPAAEAADFNRSPVPVPASVIVPFANVSPAAPQLLSTADAAPPGQSPASQRGSMVQVHTDHADFRAGSDAHAPTLLHLQRGAVLRLDDLPPQPPGFDSWRAVAIGTVHGWIATDSITAFEPKADSASTRDSATGDGSAGRMPEPQPGRPGAMRTDEATVRVTIAPTTNASPGTSTSPGTVMSPGTITSPGNSASNTGTAGTVSGGDAAGSNVSGSDASGSTVSGSDAAGGSMSGSGSPGGSTSGGNGPVTPPLRYRVLLEGVVMRDKPEPDATAIARFHTSDLLEAAPQQSQGYWTAVQAGGKRGWVATQWLAPQ